LIVAEDPDDQIVEAHPAQPVDDRPHQLAAVATAFELVEDVDGVKLTFIAGLPGPLATT